MNNHTIDSGSQDIQSPKSLSTMPKTLRRGSVLCIFENVETGMRIESAMASEHFAILRARHGMHAYWLALNSKPDLVITDATDNESSFLLDCLGRNERTKVIPLIGLIDPVQEQVVDASFNRFSAVVNIDASPLELRQIADRLIEANLKRVEIEKAKGPARQPVPVRDGVAENVDVIFSEIGHAAARRPNIAPYIGGGSVTSETIGTNL